ncbi:uncharacterized protein V1513DRAFT_265489 [Lipomyces chichibuensis]|uniref:uncharacterized protein n=1 Tax=Lipomyces chichibuensis TaxID=1546026 RepID=UPI003343F095
MVSEVTFHEHSTIDTLLRVLKPHLPQAVPLCHRLQSGLNTPDRHVLFAASFPPSSPPSLADPGVFTVLFSDRSRKSEAQVWIYNSLCQRVTFPLPEPFPPTASSIQSAAEDGFAFQNSLSTFDRAVLKRHLKSLLQFLHTHRIPSAPGWPFDSVVRLACTHHIISSALSEIVPFNRKTDWLKYIFSASPMLPPGTTNLSEAEISIPSNVTLHSDIKTEDDIALILSTSLIPRQPSTLRALPHRTLYLTSPDSPSQLVAWCFLGPDYSLMTLYVVEPYRGRGLAKYVAGRLLREVGKNPVQYGHADVSRSNLASRRLCESLGGVVGWEASYIDIDLENLSQHD